MNTNYKTTHANLVHKRIIVQLLILSLIISGSSFFSLRVKAMSGEGTASSPYLIKTMTDFYEIANNPSAHYKLANDLDFNHMKRTPINEFKGVLDGGGHTLKNITIIGDSSVTNTAIFTSLKGATIKNLTLYGINVTGKNSNTAILSGTSTDSTINITVDTCTVDSSGAYAALVTGISSNSTFSGTITNCSVKAGSGYAGFVAGSDNNSTFKQCFVDSSTLEGGSRIAGIVGNLGTGKIIECAISESTIKGNTYVGGIAGFSNSNSGAEFIDCYVSDTKLSSSGGYLGGIVGYCQSATNSYEIKDCYVSDIELSSTGNFSGGIIGYAQTLKLLNSHSIDCNISGTVYVGGIAGYLYNTTVTECMSNSPVTGTESYVGGIAGYLYDTTVQMCISENKLQGKSNVGGITGDVVRTCSILNSYAQNTIICPISTSSAAGGITGNVNPLNIKNSYAVSKITADTIYGLANGITSTSAVSCYFNEETVGVTTPATHARTTADLQQKINYTGWDFDTIWRIESGSYPKLRFADDIKVPEKPETIRLDIIMEVDEELLLSVNDDLAMNADMTWTSSAPDIVSVTADGEIKAIKAGEAVITAKSQDGSLSESVTVSVVADASELRLAVDLRVGKSFRVAMKGLKDTVTVHWSVMDSRIASVNNEGKITALSQGMTIVVSKDSDGNELGHIYVRVR